MLAAKAGRAMKQGKYREAEPLLRRALAIQEKARRADPDDKDIRETETEYAQNLRKAVRSAEVMDDPGRRPTEDDLKYLNGLKFATKQPDLASLFNSRSVQVVDDSIGDAGLVHLRGLVNAESLRVDATNITDEGLVHLERLTGVKTLILIGSKIRGPGAGPPQWHDRPRRFEKPRRSGPKLDDDGLAARSPQFPGRRN